MATSGTTTYTRNRDQIVKRALRIATSGDAGEEPTSASLDQGSDALNSMIKNWQAGGIHIWRTVEATLFLQAGQSRYDIGASSSDNAMEEFTQTTLTADATVGATSISVDSVTDVANDYYIGVQVDDGSIHWTQVNGAPVGSSVSLDVGLDDSASDGAAVFVYQTKLVRPLKILSARSFDFISSIETPLEEYDRREYQELPNKTNEGKVTGFFYDRRGGANSSGLFYAWPVPAVVDEAIKMTVQRPVQIFDAAANEPDLPEEWVEALVWNLAEILAIEYDTPDSKYAKIQAKANATLAQANWNEVELQDIEIVPARR